MALLQPAPAGSLQSVGGSLAVYDNIYQRKEDEKKNGSTRRAQVRGKACNNAVEDRGSRGTAWA